MLIGITGRIGAGKSAVSSLVAAKGYMVINADQQVHVLYAMNSEVRQKIADRFGREILTMNGLDRNRLGSLVFKDPQALVDLEAIIHPALADHLDFLIREHMHSGPVFLEAALLPKWPELLKQCDQVWLVVAEEAIRFKRVVERGLTAEDATNRIEQQKSLPDMEHPGLVKLSNDGTFAELEIRVGRLLQKVDPITS